MKSRQLSVMVGDAHSSDAFVALKDALLGGGTNGDGGGALVWTCQPLLPPDFVSALPRSQHLGTGVACGAARSSGSLCWVPAD